MRRGAMKSKATACEMNSVSSEEEVCDDQRGTARRKVASVGASSAPPEVREERVLKHVALKTILTHTPRQKSPTMSSRRSRVIIRQDIWLRGKRGDPIVSRRWWVETWVDRFAGDSLSYVGLRGGVVQNALTPWEADCEEDRPYHMTIRRSSEHRVNCVLRDLQYMVSLQLVKNIAGSRGSTTYRLVGGSLHLATRQLEREGHTPPRFWHITM